MREICEIIIWIVKLLFSPVLIGLGLITGLIEFIIALFGWGIIIVAIAIIVIIYFAKS